MTHLEIIFQDNLDPADLDILRPATLVEPGRARLAKARVEQTGSGSRVYTCNGGALIGIILAGQPAPPFDAAYLLEEMTEVSRG